MTTDRRSAPPPIPSLSGLTREQGRPVADHLDGRAAGGRIHPGHQEAFSIRSEGPADRRVDAFFAAGVHEDVLTWLARLRDLTVISRTSVMRFKNGGDVKEIGRRLGAPRPE